MWNVADYLCVCDHSPHFCIFQHISNASMLLNIFCCKVDTCQSRGTVCHNNVRKIASVRMSSYRNAHHLYMIGSCWWFIFEKTTWVSVEKYSFDGRYSYFSAQNTHRRWHGCPHSSILPQSSGQGGFSELAFLQVVSQSCPHRENV